MNEPAAPHVPPSPPPASGQGLHPLTLERIVGLTFGMLRFRRRALFGAALLPLLPAHAIAALVQAPYVATMNRWFTEAQTRLGQVALPPGWGEAVLVSVVAGLLLALVGLLATAAVTQAAGDTYAGRHTSATAVLGRAARRLPSVIGAHLLYFVVLLAIVMGGAAIALGFFVGGPRGGLMPFLGLVVVVGAVAGGLFVMVRWSLVMPALMIENRGAMEALGRSWRVVAGSGWRVLGYLLLTGFVVGIVGAALVQVVYAALPGSLAATDSGTILVGTLAAGLITTLLAPIPPVAMTLLYFDIRWRKGEVPAA
jgi:hypothetical protein